MLYRFFECRIVHVYAMQCICNWTNRVRLFVFFILSAVLSRPLQPNMAMGIDECRGYNDLFILDNDFCIFFGFVITNILYCIVYNAYENISSLIYAVK